MCEIPPEVPATTTVYVPGGALTFAGGGGGGGGVELLPHPATKVPSVSNAKDNRSARRRARRGDTKTRKNAKARPALAESRPRLSTILSNFAVVLVPGMKALIVKDAAVAPVTICDDGLTAHSRLAEDGEQESETVVLPPFGPPSSIGTEVL